MKAERGVLESCDRVATYEKRLIGLQAKENRVGIAIVPTAADGGVARHFVVADHLQVAAHKLLTLTQIEHGVLAEEMGDVDEEAACGGIVDAIERTALGGGNLGADVRIESRGVIAKCNVFADAPLGNHSPRLARLCRCLFDDGCCGQIGLDEHVAILLAAASTADVGLRKAEHGFRHLSPSGIGQHPAVGPRLHHAKRHAGAGERASHPNAADARVHMLPHLSHQRGSHHAEYRQQILSHAIFVLARDSYSRHRRTR